LLVVLASCLQVLSDGRSIVTCVLGSTQLESQRRGLQSAAAQQPPAEWVDRFGSEPRKGADILVQCLEREGVQTLFAYPGGASMEIHQALTRSQSIRNILCRHEQVPLCMSG
jgi:acetolactate synthase I/II/III large subunit